MIGTVVTTGKLPSRIVAEIFVTVTPANHQHPGGHGRHGSSHRGAALEVRQDDRLPAMAVLGGGRVPFLASVDVPQFHCC